MTDPKATTQGPGGTPEGHTSEAPTPDEYGMKGTPATELSSAVPHVADAEEVEDAHADDQAEAGHADAHAADPLGPIDWRAWGMSLVGVLVALGVVVALALPTLRL